MAKTTNHYEVLGVRREASQAEIRNAYRNLAKTLHPDHPGGSAEKFSRIQEANAVLSDPDRRREHDEALDLAHAADQLAGLNFDFDGSEDELSSRRRARESGGPSLGERFKGRFGRKEGSSGGGAGGPAPRPPPRPRIRRPLFRRALQGPLRQERGIFGQGFRAGSRKGHRDEDQGPLRRKRGALVRAAPAPTQARALHVRTRALTGRVLC